MSCGLFCPLLLFLPLFMPSGKFCPDCRLKIG
jgi:hypothetical protein